MLKSAVIRLLARSGQCQAAAEACHYCLVCLVKESSPMAIVECHDLMKTAFFMIRLKTKCFIYVCLHKNSVTAPRLSLAPATTHPTHSTTFIGYERSVRHHRPCRDSCNLLMGLHGQASHQRDDASLGMYQAMQLSRACGHKNALLALSFSSSYSSRHTQSYQPIHFI